MKKRFVVLSAILTLILLAYSCDPESECFDPEECPCEYNPLACPLPVGEIN